MRGALDEYSRDPICVIRYRRPNADPVQIFIVHRDVPYESTDGACRAASVPSPVYRCNVTGRAVRASQLVVIQNYAIEPARARHIDDLADIERAAARLLVGHAPEHVLRETTATSVLRSAAEEHRLWVATVGDKTVGFAHVELLAAGSPHLEELDVHPRYGRRGLGTALVREVCSWIRASGFRRLTLTTFREPPWNMPFYARVGFVELPRRDWGAELALLVANETGRGLDPTTRVVMSWAPR